MAKLNSKTIDKIKKRLISSWVDKNKHGLEVGPSYNGICRKSDQYNVDIVDHFNEHDLRKKYSHLGNNEIENIEHVDYVWKGESLSGLINKKYDWIVASHVIEHMPNLIDFLKQCESLLNNNGNLVLVVPDKRYCFDHYRQLTCISKVIDVYENNSKTHSKGSYIDHALNSSTRNGGGCWSRYGSLKKKNISLSSKKTPIIDIINSSNNISFDTDIHNWVFTPSSFFLLIHDLNKLGYINIGIKEIKHTISYEFYVCLEKGIKNTNIDRLEYLEKIQYEIKDGILKRPFFKNVFYWAYGLISKRIDTYNFLKI